MIIIMTVISLLFNIIFPVIRNWSRFTERFDPKLYEKKYNRSQYVIPQSKNPISDEELLSHAGYQYVKGLNPVLINSDHPPLGKYIIGWFTILFKNNRVVSLFFGFANLLIIFILVNYLTKSRTAATVALLFMSLDTMFVDQIIYSPILDIIQVFFLLVFFLVYFVWRQTKKTWLTLILGIILGCFGSIKIYFPALLLLTVTGLAVLIEQKNVGMLIKTITPIFVLAFLTYTLTYWSFFVHGNNLRSFLGTQKWIFLFWKNNSIDRSRIFANVLPLILFNRWRVWWGNQPYISFERWSIGWPIFFLMGVRSSLYFLIKRQKTRFTHLFEAGSYLSLWEGGYLVYACCIPFSPRYLMLLFFPLYIIITLSIKAKFPKYV